MSSDVLALVIGTALAVGSLAFVLHPLFFGAHEQRVRRAAERSPEESAVVALREIEFDRATGKLSDADYAALKRAYTERALVELRASASASEDPVEARVRAYRAVHRECAACGLRPEADAVYCSTCGAYLDRVCADCGAEIVEAGAAYCSVCGARLRRDGSTSAALH